MYVETDALSAARGMNMCNDRYHIFQTRCVDYHGSSRELLTDVAKIEPRKQKLREGTAQL